jgi:hypothetical protein
MDMKHARLPSIDTSIVVHISCIPYVNERNFLRDWLYKNGEILVNHIHHEEYKWNGKVYVCGWASPSVRFNEEGGWFVYLKTEEKEES